MATMVSAAREKGRKAGTRAAHGVGQAGHAAGSDPRGALGGDGGGRARLPDGRGHRRLRRRVQGHGRLPRALRSGARDRHADQRGRLHRRGRGRGAHGAAPRGRDAVHGLRVVRVPAADELHCHVAVPRVPGRCPWSCAARSAAGCAAGRSTRRTRRWRSSTRPGSRSSTRATAYDAKGLLKAAIRDDDPVLYFEHKKLYRLPALREVLPQGGLRGAARQGAAAPRGQGRHDRDVRHAWSTRARRRRSSSPRRTGSRSRSST